MKTYETPEGVDKYIKMCDGYDNSNFRENILEYLKQGSSLLEVGMGPGNDYLWLQELYKVTGSDYSTEFLKRAKKRFPRAEFKQLDGLTLETDEKYDAIFSSKVYQHIKLNELKNAINRQSEILNNKGLIIHAFWIGDYIFKHEDMLFYYHNKDALINIIKESFDVLYEEIYKEFEDGDSLFLIASKK